MSASDGVPGLSKHLFNDAETAVLGSLESAVLVNPALVLDRSNKIVFRNPNTVQDSANKISLICGGGSGHEPAWAGFVGFRFLTAAVAGTVFASPSAEQVKACVSKRLPKDTKGILVIVKNYTGDVLNFGRAVESARAIGKDVEMLVVGDDVGVGREKSGKVGRRGVAGTVLVVKACGALAEMGASLQDCTKVGQLVANNLVTVALSLSRTHVPGRSSQDAKDEESRLPQGKVELGMGIHNEPGCAQLDADLPKNVATMLKQLLDSTDSDRAYVDIQASRGDEVILLINNFGGISNLELGAATTEVCRQLSGTYGLKPLRIITGTFVGSLDGRGFSITLLKVEDTGLGQGKSLLDLLDAPSDCAAWPIGASTPAGVTPQIISGGAADEASETDSGASDEPSNILVDPAQYEKILTAGLEQVIAAEPEVTKYDSLVGDGDCGTGLKRGAEAVLKSLKERSPGQDLLVNLPPLVQAVEGSMDGTSGAIYAIFLNALVRNLRERNPSQPEQATPALWAAALSGALAGLEPYTPAKAGDRTMIDALAPFIESLAGTSSLQQAAAAAERGAESTRGMHASLGRTVYVGGDGFKQVPDPGAHGLAALFKGMAAASGLGTGSGSGTGA